MAKKKKKDAWEKVLQQMSTSKNSRVLDASPVTRKNTAKKTESKRKTSARETASRQMSTSKNSRVLDTAPVRRSNTSTTKKEYRNSTTKTQNSGARATANRVATTSRNSRVEAMGPLKTPERRKSNVTGPLKQSDKNIGGNQRTWVKKPGAFDDGYQVGDVTKTILGTATDVLENAAAGVLGMGERIVDASAYMTPGGYLQHAVRFNEVPDMKLYEKTKTEMDKFVANDLYDEQKIANKIITQNVKKVGIDGDKDSILGERSASVAQSFGQLEATKALQNVGIPWFATTGITSFAGEAENALRQGATHEEAGMSGLITAGADVLTELFSGGINFGGKTLDEGLVNSLTRRISNKVVRTLAKLGMDAAGEGAEEIVASVCSNLGTKFYKDESVNELLTSEEAMDEYVESFIGGAVLGGGSSVINAVKSSKAGRDYATGLTDNELKVVQKEIQKRISEKESEGKKVKGKDKNKISDQVQHDLEKGYIDIGTIEETLGGETYTKYKQLEENEAKLQQEYDELHKMKRGDMTGEQLERESALKEQLDALRDDTSKSDLRKQLDAEMEKTTENDLLLRESYNEKSRKGQAFEADLSEYDAKQQETVKKAAESGILNNTNRTHDFVDMVAKISADKGVTFDFTNNERLKESGFAVEGKTVNGYVKDGSITVNINSNKALNTIVGHEITHVLEGTELYTELQNAVKEYATTKGEYQTRYDDFKNLYKDVDDAMIDNEVTADLVGDYLFADADFISRLSTEKPNVFQKIYEEIKYLVKTVTGSKEARELEKVKRAFDRAYKEGDTSRRIPSEKNWHSEVTPERITSREDDVSYSLSYNSEIAKGQTDYVAKGKGNVTEEELANAHEVTNAMVDVMMKYSNILPEDKIGKVLTKNGSYDRSVENTTICVRTLAYNEFVDKVQEEIGRPLTQMESFLVSQKLYDIATEPQCMYCYVSLDRKAFNDMLLRYMTDRDTVIDKYNKSDKSDKAVKDLYTEFLNGRKDTKPMKDRFNKWISDVDNGVQLLSLADIATEERQSVIKANGGNLARQLADARKYAQSASWSKIQKNYVAYRDEILKLGDRVVKNLNEHYGLRWYSFSDYSPAFIVENMQQITDASIRGLKGLSYTKDTDYAEIFASSGMNINVSVFVNQDANGDFYIDEKQSADFEKAKALRDKYPNVGIVATVTNDEALRWAGEQEWSDVIIPFHIVRTGNDVAQYYKWLNYTAESADTIKDRNLWDAYVDSLNIKSENARKKVSKNIYPNEHKNDKTTYLTLCENRGLAPRFARFAAEDWYMKLVNETRLSSEESIPLKPTYNLEAAQASFQRFIEKGGYEGGWYKEGVDVETEAKEVASDVLAGKQANEVSYGRQDNFNPYEILSGRKTNRNHGKFSLSEETQGNGGDDYSVELDGRTPEQILEDLNNMSDDNIFKPLPEEKLGPVREDVKGDEPTNDETKMSDEERVAILESEPKTESGRNKRKAAIFLSNIVSKGLPFENLAIKTKNRELMGKWDYMLKTEARAQHLMGKGDPENGIKALNDIQEEIGNNGLTNEFQEYMYHKHNIDRMTLENRFKGAKNKPVFGENVTAEMSERIVKQYEKERPEFIEYAKDVYDYNKYLRQQMVDSGILSEETAKLWEEMYPNYVPIRRVKGKEMADIPQGVKRTGVNAPIKRATGGDSDILPLFSTMGSRTMQVYRATAKNSFGVELKNTLGSEAIGETTSLDDIIDGIDYQGELLKLGDNGSSPTFSVYENGEKKTFNITKDMYDALTPLSDSSMLSKTFKPLNIASNIHRGLLTEYNITFMLTNAIKDVQDVLINSQHPVKTYSRIPEAHAQMITKGYWYNEYMKHGGEQNSYFNNETNTFDVAPKGVEKVLDSLPLRAISTANNYIEMIPRLAEYIASREAGRSIEVSMLDAARVTTNFSEGGDLTKFINRNGGTFLNASVQGAMQQVRNVREANMNGWKGWASLATKFAVAGAPLFLLNGLLWDDDEEYDKLSDYVKQNYYVVAKTGDGKFLRIPKGRTTAVIQEGLQMISNASSGDDDVDLKEYLNFVVDNLAPNNPLTNNVLAPIKQVMDNETWYGEDLVPSRLQDLPASEQYDESTDSFSRFLGEKLNVSPMKINYLLNQYSGGVGDIVLPFMTPKAESGSDSVLGKVMAPLKDKFMTDGIMNSQYVSDFYDKSDELTLKAKRSDATEEDILRSQYFNSVSSEISKLYAEKREIQSKTVWSDKMKYDSARKVQEEINELMKEALNSYENIETSGNYTVVGGHQFLKGDDGWKSISEEQVEKQEKASKLLGISAEKYWSNEEDKKAYDWAVKYPDYYQLSRTISDDVLVYWKHNSYIWNNIRADKDENGKSIAGTKKSKVIDYINGTDLEYEERIMLYKKYYPADDTYNEEIIDYLNNRDDITYEQMETILKQLDFTVDKNGNIYW